MLLSGHSKSSSRLSGPQQAVRKAAEPQRQVFSTIDQPVRAPVQFYEDNRNHVADERFVSA